MKILHLMQFSEKLIMEGIFADDEGMIDASSKKTSNLKTTKICAK